MTGGGVGGVSVSGSGFLSRSVGSVAVGVGGSRVFSGSAEIGVGRDEAVAAIYFAYHLMVADKPGGDTHDS